MVYSYQRSISSVEYINTANNLYQYVVRLASSCSKKYTFFGVKQVYDTTFSILDATIRANSLRVDIDYRERRNLLNFVIGKIHILAAIAPSVVGSIKFTSKRKLKNGETKDVADNKKRMKTIEILSGFLVKLEKLVKGVLKSDRERYINYLKTINPELNGQEFNLEYLSENPQVMTFFNNASKIYDLLAAYEFGDDFINIENPLTNLELELPAKEDFQQSKIDQQIEENMNNEGLLNPNYMKQVKDKELYEYEKKYKTTRRKIS